MIKTMVLRKYIKSCCLIFSMLFLVNHSLAQENEPTLPQYLLIHFAYSFQNPGADMADRFGSNSALGLGFDYLNSKNFIFGVHGDFLFGRNVNEDVLWNLRNSDGQIIGNNRGIANISLVQRGLHTTLVFGKLIPFKKSNPRLGLRLTVGAGFFQHKIKIQQDPQSLVPQTEGEYAKGYDRLTNGFSISQFIGIQKVSDDKKLNFMLGLELVQGFTSSQRSFDFDRRATDTTKYFDFLLGGKIAYTLPFEIGGNPDEIFY